jgi:hypothetical protein
MSKPSNACSEGIINRASQDSANDTGMNGSPPPSPSMTANSLFEMAQLRFNGAPNGVGPYPRRSFGSPSTVSPSSRRLQLVEILDEAIRIGDDFLLETERSSSSLPSLPVSGRESRYEGSRQ